MIIQSPIYQYLDDMNSHLLRIMKIDGIVEIDFDELLHKIKVDEYYNHIILRMHNEALRGSNTNEDII